MTTSILGFVGMLFFGRNHSHDVVEEAIKRSRAVGASAEALDKNLKPYLEHRFPFNAMASDLYNRGAENRHMEGLRDDLKPTS